MNKKPTILAVAALGSLAMIGTGFAGWVITAEATSHADGSITAHAVTDERYTKTVEHWDNGDPNGADDAAKMGNGVVNFGKPEDTATIDESLASTPWLVFDGTAVERVNPVYTVAGTTSGTQQPKITVVFKINDTADGAYAYAIDNHLITGPKGTASEGDGPKVYTTTLTIAATAVLTEKQATVKDDNTAPTLTVVETFDASATPATWEIETTIGLDWGSAFDGKNPYEFYNNKTVAEKGDEAKGYLDRISALQGVSYSLDVTIEGPTAA